MANFIQFPDHSIAEIIQPLGADTIAIWGIMTPQHMLEHLLLPLQFSQGKFSVPLVTPIEKVEKVKRIMLLSDAPLKRDFAAPFLGDGLQPLIYPSLEAAKEALMAEIQSYLTFWEINPGAVFTHPIFGDLNQSDWYLFHQKHFTHHFSQFGLV